MKTDQQRAEEALNMAVEGVDIRETRRLSAIANDMDVPLHKRRAASRALRVLTNQYACVSIGSSASPLAERAA